jgi:hypothetical protein
MRAHTGYTNGAHCDVMRYRGVIQPVNLHARDSQTVAIERRAACIRNRGVPCNSKEATSTGATVRKNMQLNTVVTLTVCGELLPHHHAADVLPSQ